MSMTITHKAEGDHMVADEIRCALSDADDTDDVKVTTTWRGRITSITITKP